MNRNILLGFILISFAGVWGCAGIPGMIATQVGGQLIARGTQDLSDQIFGPPWWQTVAQQQYQAQRVECKIIEGKEYCRPVPSVSVEVSTPAPASSSPAPVSSSGRGDKTIKQGDCTWRPTNGGEWDCLSKTKKGPSPPVASVR